MRKHIFWLCLTPLFLSACASYQTKLDESLSLMRNGRAADAVEKIKPPASEEGNDQVAFMFELGTALQMAQDYKTSNDIFLKVEDLTDIKDYHSLSRIGGSVLLSEGLMQYKGEDYEKVLINAMLGINFLMLNDKENAQVEMRKLNDKLYKYKFEAKRDYEQNPFAFYLSAMIWEDEKKWDDAYIDYKRAYEVNPGIAYLRKDLLRLSRLAHRRDEFEKWRATFPDEKVDDLKGAGEIVLILQQGWGPRKFAHPDFPRVPKLYPVVSQTHSARIMVNGAEAARSEVISSVQDVAIKTLDDAYAGLIAKRVAGIAAKAVVSDQLRQKNELLGQLAWIGLNLADRADLRQWVSLPQTFQVARTRVPMGQYSVQFEGLNWEGQPSGEVSPTFEAKVLRPGQKVFLGWRTVK